MNTGVAGVASEAGESQHCSSHNAFRSRSAGRRFTLYPQRPLNITENQNADISLADEYIALVTGDFSRFDSQGAARVAMWRLRTATASSCAF